MILAVTREKYQSMLSHLTLIQSSHIRYSNCSMLKYRRWRKLLEISFFRVFGTLVLAKYEHRLESSLCVNVSMTA
jgi:hypothetical protein